MIILIINILGVVIPESSEDLCTMNDDNRLRRMDRTTTEGGGIQLIS